jgi:hypothetical protein
VGVDLCVASIANLGEFFFWAYGELGYFAFDGIVIVSTGSNMVAMVGRDDQDFTIGLVADCASFLENRAFDVPMYEYFDDEFFAVVFSDWGTTICAALVFSCIYIFIVGNICASASVVGVVDGDREYTIYVAEGSALFQAGFLAGSYICIAQSHGTSLVFVMGISTCHLASQSRMGRIVFCLSIVVCGIDDMGCTHRKLGSSIVAADIQLWLIFGIARL